MSAGAKGGTGKTTVLGLIADWLYEAGITPLLIDCDDENASLSRFHPESRKIEPTKVKAYYEIVDTIEKGEHPVIICDFKGGVRNSVRQFAEVIPFEELSEMGAKFVLVCAITSSPDSVSSVLGWVDFLASRVKYLVVRNLKDHDTEGVDPKKIKLPENDCYDCTRQALQFRKLYKPAEIIMPSLDKEYMGELERFNLTIRDFLAKYPDVPPLLSSMIVRSILRKFQTGIFEQLDTHRHLLLPE
jgi:hypothetical protein